MALTKEERERLPSTLQRSPAKAQATYIHTLESAEETYDGDEERERIDVLELAFGVRVGGLQAAKHLRDRGLGEARAPPRGALARAAARSSPAGGRLGLLG